MGIGNNEILTVTDNFKLIFYINKKLFSYSIFNTLNNCFEEIKQLRIDDAKDFSQQLEHILNSESNLRKSYTQIIGAIDTNISTFIPESLFDKKKLKNYIDLTTKSNKENGYIYTKQQFVNCYSIFTINKNVEKKLNKKFKNLTLKNFPSIFVDYTLHLARKNKKDFFLCVDADRFHATLIENKNFIFYNQFEFNTIDDFLYHLLNCLHILDLNINSVKIKIITDLERNHKIFNILAEYIKLIEFINRPSEFIYGNKIMNDEEHKNQKIFTQLICE